MSLHTQREGVRLREAQRGMTYHGLSGGRIQSSHRYLRMARRGLYLGEEESPVGDRRGKECCTLESDISMTADRICG